MAPKKSPPEAPATPRKRRRGRGKQSGGQRWLSVFLRFVLPATLVLAAVALLVIFTMGGQKAEVPELRAAIVDQLGLNEPDAEFVQSARSTLEQAGYTVDYYPPEQVTVDFYRSLPKQKYSLIVFRVHIARFDEASLTMDDPQRRQAMIDAFGQSVFLFTSEQYDSSKYSDDRQNLRLFQVRNLTGTGDTRYFGITPHFIVDSMQGDFSKTVVLLMGCDGLLFDGTAKAFVDKGAQAVVGWNSLVSGPHTDRATESLLQKLVPQKLSLGEAVKRTNSEVTPEPAYNNALKIYPEKAADLVLPRG
jgi:hypothetical protein